MILSRAGLVATAICRNIIRNRVQFAKYTIRPINYNFMIENNVRLMSTGFAATAVPPNSVPAIENPVTIIDKLPNVRITRKIVGARDKIDLDLVLFQYQTCPFCCKVRVFLDSQGISYSVVEVDAVLRQDTKWSTYKKVPMMLARTKDGRYVQLTDSTAIVSILATLLENPAADIVELATQYANVGRTGVENDTGIRNKYYLALSNSATNTNEEERKWRAWTDRHLINLISPNVYGSVAESVQTFKWFSKAGQWDVIFPRWERHLMVYSGAAIMYLISKRLKKHHKLTDDVRSHIYAACNQWLAELKEAQFHGGSKPNLADLAVFGALNSFEGCQAFDDLKQNTKIEPWFNAVSEYVERNRGKVVKLV